MLIAARNGFLAGGGWKNPYVTDGLVQYYDAIWNFAGGVHDSSYGNLMDLSGNGNNGILSAYATIGSDSVVIQGVRGYGISFRGEITSQYTLEIVIKMMLNQWEGSPRLTAEPPYPSMYFRSNSSPSSALGFYGQGLDNSLMTESNRTERTYCAVTYDGQYVTGYLNGLACSQQLYTTTAPTSVTTATIGNRESGGRGWDGEVCVFRRSSRALTASEIAANYAVDKARFNLP